MATKPAEADNRGRMICSWCGRDLGPSGTAQDSHGICADCDRKLREKAGIRTGLCVSWKERANGVGKA